MNSNYKIDISVVIPVYNSEKTIADCVNSVIKEIEHNSLKYEIILVNDGSTDSSKKILPSLQEGEVYLWILSFFFL